MYLVDKCFDRPISVEPLYSRVHSRLIYVHDPARGISFPVDPKNLKTIYELTKKQRKAAGLA